MKVSIDGSDGSTAASDGEAGGVGRPFDAFESHRMTSEAFDARYLIISRDTGSWTK